MRTYGGWLFTCSQCGKIHLYDNYEKVKKMKKRDTIMVGCTDSKFKDEYEKQEFSYYCGCGNVIDILVTD